MKNKSRNTDFEQLFEDIGLPPFVDDASVRTERAEADLQFILNQSRATQEEPTVIPRRPLRSAWAWSAAAAVFIGASLFLNGFLPGSPEPVAASISHAMLEFSRVSNSDAPFVGEPARDVLLDLAEKAETLPPLSDKPIDHIQFVASWAQEDQNHQKGFTNPTVTIQSTIDQFFFANGDFRSIEKYGPALDQRGREVDGFKMENRPINKTYDDYHVVDPRETQRIASERDALPTTPAKLHQHIVQWDEDYPGRTLLSFARDHLASRIVDGATHALVWRTLAEEPELMTLGTTTDRFGRKAVVIAAPPDTARQNILLIDATTGAFLGSESILIADQATDFEPPAVMELWYVKKYHRITPSELPDEANMVVWN